MGDKAADTPIRSTDLRKKPVASGFTAAPKALAKPASKPAPAAPKATPPLLKPAAAVVKAASQPVAAGNGANDDWESF